MTDPEYPMLFEAINTAIRRSTLLILVCQWQIGRCYTAIIIPERHKVWMTGNNYNSSCGRCTQFKVTMKPHDSFQVVSHHAWPRIVD